MAGEILIDLSNYDSLLKQCTGGGRAGTPNGNIYFDVANGRIEIITQEELATVDIGGVIDNPLTQQLGIKLEALYAFENQERRTDETLRQYDRYFKGTFKFGGAYELVKGRKFDDADGTATSLTTDDRNKVRGSGWIERDVDGVQGRIYYGIKSLGNIEAASVPYYQLDAGLAGTAVPFDKSGDVDEAIQVFGNSGIDANSDDIDALLYMSMKVRTFGQNFDEKILIDSGVTEMGGYSSGFALSEGVHLTSGAYTLADVYTTPIAPWDTMSLEKLAGGSEHDESGFTTADGVFTWYLTNTAGNLNQCVAFLDALAITGDDIDNGTETITKGNLVGTWYYYKADGTVVTQSGADGLGLFIENIPTIDEQKINFTADDTTLKARPFSVGISVEVGAGAKADTNAWYHAFFEDGPGAGDDFNTAGALTVVDADTNDVKGNVATDAIGTAIVFPFNYDGDTIGGPTETDKWVVFECEGDGGVTQAKTIFEITRSTAIGATCQPSSESNV